MESDRIHKVQQRVANADVVFLSFPKSGRTWIRFFLAKYIEHRFSLPFSLEFNYSHAEIPQILFSHNFFDVYQEESGEPSVLFTDILATKKLVLVVRDPRDVAVSYYHQKKERERVTDLDIDAFMRSPIYGIERQSQFVLQLLDFASAVPNKLIINYSDLKQQPQQMFSHIVQFVFAATDTEAVAQAVEDAAFDNMKQFEKQSSTAAADANTRLSGGEWDGNENSLKVRKGKVGGYAEELAQETLDYIAELPYTSKLLEQIAAL